MSRKRPRDGVYSLRVFDLRATGGWTNLLDLNGGTSAPWITAAPGDGHSTHMCCLVLHEPATPHKPNRLERLQPLCGEEPWWRYRTRIAIVIPVAVQSGIALAQGIKRLERTCPCPHLKRLGMVLLAYVARHFELEYLFLSPIGPFADHVQRELTARGVPFGRLGKRSLWWALEEEEEDSSNDEEEEDEEKDADAHQWLTIRSGLVNYARRGRFRSQEVYYLRIRPQPPFQPQAPRPQPRTLLLNSDHYVPCGGHCDPEHEPPPHVKFETHDFLWFLAGDGVLVVHGPSLGASVPPHVRALE